MTDGRQYQAGEDMDARARVKRLERIIARIDAYQHNLATNRDFKPLSIAEDLALMLDGHRPDTPPPPEGDPCDTCGGARKIAVDTPCPDCQGRGRKDAPHTPQAHGDALADYRDIEDYADYGRQLFCSKVEFDRKCANVRQALTASGVPYVPEEVRRLPERMDQEANARDDGDFISDHTRGVVDATHHWVKVLRDALASAPAVERVPTDVAKRIIAARNAFLEGDVQEVWHQLYGIADPDYTQPNPWAELERIAAAPQRGGEHD